MLQSALEVGESGRSWRIDRGTKSDSGRTSKRWYVCKPNLVFNSV